MVCDPRSCAHPKSQRCTAYTGMSRISWASSRAARPASRRSVRSGQRCSDRRCAAADGGEDAESAGLVLADEAFQGGCPIWCDPRSCAHLKSSAGHRMWLVCLTSRVAPTPRIPFAPCDPASGSRTGGATLRRVGGRVVEEFAGLVLADEACQGFCSPDGVQPTELCPPEKPSRVSHTTNPSR